MEGLALTRRSIGGVVASRRGGGRPRPRAPRAGYSKENGTWSRTPDALNTDPGA